MILQGAPNFFESNFDRVELFLELLSIVKQESMASIVRALLYLEGPNFCYNNNFTREKGWT